MHHYQCEPISLDDAPRTLASPKHPNPEEGLLQGRADVVFRPGIVHRLDIGTSGLLVVAKNDWVHHLLTEMFKRREVNPRCQVGKRRCRSCRLRGDMCPS